MSNTGSIPLPAAHALRKLGRDLALARRKRGISTRDMAARLFVSRDTLGRMERGDSTVALGTWRQQPSSSARMIARSTSYPAEPTIMRALDAAPRFGLKLADAKKILSEVFVAVSGWRTTGKRLGLKASTLDAYASAFQHPLMDEARQILGR